MAARTRVGDRSGRCELMQTREDGWGVRGRFRDGADSCVSKLLLIRA
jgi:hypothetical protein